MFLKNLREQTAAAHTALESNALSTALTADSVTFDDYSNYLARLYPFVAGFEKNVFPMLTSQITDLQQRVKTPLMQQDLQGREAIPMIPDEVFTTNYTTAADAWGAMYVMEGSTLGGQVILKHLRKQLGEDFNSAYFSAYGPQLGSHWKHFLEQLTQQAADKNAEGAIINSAVKTFSLLDTWMQGHSLDDEINQSLSS